MQLAAFLLKPFLAFSIKCDTGKLSATERVTYARYILTVVIRTH
jgi:hypothetical protein